MAKILFVMTGADQWTLADGTKHPTGYWADEAVAPYEAFKAAGHEITVATPGGVVPPVDAASLSPRPTTARRTPPGSGALPRPPPNSTPRSR
ncbi:hypothetical protein SSPO_090610 [Streptomyces antimycoticus]|uniref:DJ-1/PfpI domain-containing protein n=1 Tax=Streptomyces antimycoticus TaxID=68175 RepID=A0A499UWC0_9ACTN|nr:hypothetical protein SSPO_090610 [Streptomyces antimycoticus]